MSSKEQKQSHELRETGRVEAFSDGVFAIALTLLILEIRIPPVDDINSKDGLINALLNLWPSFFAFILSFLSLLIAWINHHRLFTHIKRIDGPFLFINGVLLMFITFMPFPTALLASYIRRPEASIAAVLYSGSMLAIASGFQILWRYSCYKSRLFNKNCDLVSIKKISTEYTLTFPIFIAAFALSFYNFKYSLALTTFMLFFYAIKGFTATDTD